MPIKKCFSGPASRQTPINWHNVDPLENSLNKKVWRYRHFAMYLECFGTGPVLDRCTHAHWPSNEPMTGQLNFKNK